MSGTIFLRGSRKPTLLMWEEHREGVVSGERPDLFFSAASFFRASPAPRFMKGRGGQFENGK